ncbi:MAG: response regulator, partial [Desulfobacterales bacterium]
METTILLVDDEPDIRDVLSLTLSDMGCQVYEAENGDEALRIFKDVQPSMVMTDIKMPGMDGIELLQKIKHENPETEVIMITGHGDMDLAIRSLKNEATDFVTKPINVDALEIAVKRAKDKIITRKKLQEYTESLEKL